MEVRIKDLEASNKAKRNEILHLRRHRNRLTKDIARLRSELHDLKHQPTPTPPAPPVNTRNFTTDALDQVLQEVCIRRYPAYTSEKLVKWVTEVQAKLTKIGIHSTESHYVQKSNLRRLVQNMA